MGTPVSLRLARLLLVAAGALTIGTTAYIAVQTSSIGAAAPWLALLILNGGAFVGAALLLGQDPRRARILAVGAAVAMGALGTITGWGAGMLSFPAIALGALGAWATFATTGPSDTGDGHPPSRRRVLIGFLVYVAIGLALAIPTMGAALLYPWTLAFVLIWPIRVLLLPTGSVIGLYVVLAIGVSLLLLALVRRRTFTATLTLGLWMTLGAIAVLAGVAAVALFNVYAIARPDTSARFELDGLVLAIVFVGGLLSALGILTLRLRPSTFTAFAIGFGVVALFLVFTYQPAVTCRVNGSGSAAPLAWELRGVSGWTTWSGGSGSATAPSSGPSVSTGEIRRGDRVATYRCEGDRLVEYRETR